MINFTNKITNTSIEKCIILKERVPSVKYYYYNLIRNYTNKYFTPYGYYSQLEKLISIYKKLYNENLTNEEKTIFLIFYIIENDNTLKKDIIRTNCNLGQIAKKYCLSEDLIKLRWNLMKEIQKYNSKNEKKLTLKKDDN